MNFFVLRYLNSFWKLFFNLYSRFYNCVGGVAYDLPCATGLVFDEAQGTCVREEQTSEFAKKCEKSLVKGSLHIEAFRNLEWK